MKLQFFGAAGTVTGSKYFVSTDTTNVLVDCGLFQGPREWREKNWMKLPFNPASISAVLLTHAHIDHTGILPRWFANGLNCPIYCTQATYEISKLLLPDSGRLQEEEAQYRAEKKRSRHEIPLPLYTEKEAERVLDFFRVVSFNKAVKLPAGELTANWIKSGHILGAASISLSENEKNILFSGDLGRFNDPVTTDPEAVNLGDLTLIESTYGNKSHSDSDPADRLAEIINRTAEKGGIVLVPSFAVGRTQAMLYYISILKREGKIPNLEIIIDSPMAADVTSIYQHHLNLLGDEMRLELQKGTNPLLPPRLRFVRDRSDSIRLNSQKGPMIIISASGMLSGGRILHHLKNRLGDAKNSVVFVGFQPPGGKGDRLLKGAKVLNVLAEEIPVRAQICEISGLSAHGDQEDLINWCKMGKGNPRNVRVVHGEPEAAVVFRDKLKNVFGWNVEVARFGEVVEV